MSSPVIVSRIQNRRGTQTQFNGLIYTPGGPNSLYPLPTPTYPGGTGYYPGNPLADPNFTSANYPNVLMPGELAFCTDTFNVYIGNVNGAYTLINASVGPTGDLTPVVWSLPPTQPPGDTPVFDFINNPQPFEYNPTPFFNILYNVTDAPPPNWDALGSVFSKNGELKITAILGGPATLTDTGTEINTAGIFFAIEARYNTLLNKIEIWYSHDHLSNLTFSTSTIHWLPF